MIHKENIAYNFSKATKNYDRFAHVQKQNAHALISTLMESNKQYGKVLDVGCGTGFLISILEKKIQFQELHAIDISSSMIDYCKSRWKNYHFMVGDAETYNYTNSYNLIVSNFVAQWFNNIPNFIKYHLSHLNEGGTLAISLPVDGSLKELKEHFHRHDLSLNLFPLPHAEQIIEQTNPTYYHLGTIEETYASPFEVLNALSKIGASNKAFWHPFHELRRLKLSYPKGTPFSTRYNILTLHFNKENS